MASDSRPIGVFDSGIGGLTVLSALRDQFPDENFIYVGDTARLPYGSKSPQTIRRYAEQIAQFLLKQNVKALVVACNSASTQMQESEINGIPVYNVIVPGARKALEMSPRLRIGLMGTRATVASEAYGKEIVRQNPQAQVFSQACPLLVPLAEEGWDADPVTNLIVYRYIQPLMEHQIDVLILGCTHYPLLAGSITRVTGSSLLLVDSGAAIANDMEKDLQSGRWKAGRGGSLKLNLTDDSQAFRHLSKRILGLEPEIELIDLI